MFLLYAEDRDLIPSRTDAEARAFYAQGYGVRSLYGQLLDDRAHHPDTMDERRGAWGRLLALFSLVHQGDSTRRWIRGRGGRLFDPAAYPFLQGQDIADDEPAPAPVSDGCVLRILDSLITVDGEKLSYRTLDVEQIGSVYETVMGFAIETRPGSAVAIKAGKNDRTPVFVDLAALAVEKGSDRAKFLKAEASRHSLSDKVSKALAAATGGAHALEALRPIIDERGSPGGHISPPGTPLLQPTDERRRTGSHYTPRSLTQPIVKHALEPAFERIGPNARPEDVLALKVVDPAMGSGAFLVEACRALGDRLVQAWERWPETRPTIPDDEDPPLHARRLVAQRSLYGVDKNPRAVELAKLSLWLATLARDHEFTFLDHALKCGDSLVGLDAKQIAAMHWDPSKPGLPLFRKFVADRVADATRARAEIQLAPDDTERVILEQKHRAIESVLADVRTLGDAVISAFFLGDKPGEREKLRATIESWITAELVDWSNLRMAAAGLRTMAQPLSPFHWAVEFPEVFAPAQDGFDAVVGNPPFQGVTSLGMNTAICYTDYLRYSYHGAGGKCDLVAFFFRRSFDLLRDYGCMGLIGSKSVAQGHTRISGLAYIAHSGGSIIRAIKRYRWIGEANVVVSIIHIVKKVSRSTLVTLNGKCVDSANSFLVQGKEINISPLFENINQSYVGAVVRGEGFVIDINDGDINVEDLFIGDPSYRSVVKQYWGGESFNNSPTMVPSRYVIDFEEKDLDEARQWPKVLTRLEDKVKIQRASSSAKSAKERSFQTWWRFGRRAKALHEALRNMEFCLGRAEVSWHHMVGRVKTGPIFQNKIVVFLHDDFRRFSILQSRVHELWAYLFGSSMKNDLSYVPRSCYHTFPFPTLIDDLHFLEDIGRTYNETRSSIMLERGEGLTKTYNHFHDPTERASEILGLRALHAKMDRDVLSAYAASASTPDNAAAWTDLADRAEPVFLDETNEDDPTYQNRLFWPSAFRDEVLAHLLALNAERATAEKAAGLSPLSDRDEEQEEIEV